jgi:hypothetical protein
MKDNPKKNRFDVIETLSALTDRYLNSDINDAHLALVEAEKLLRGNSGIPSSKFALAVTMAKRSDIVFHLGDAQTASSIMADALQIFREEPMAARAGLLTSEGVLKFIREQDTTSNVKWRQSDHAA